MAGKGPPLLSTDVQLMYYGEDLDEIHETEVLSGVVRRQSKYGSTSSHTNRFAKQKCISHVVQPHDTLQGLALKYSVTMEQIRRANRMYTSDSLFCKSVLSIPVPAQDSDTALLPDLSPAVVVEKRDQATSSAEILIKGHQPTDSVHQKVHSHSRKAEEQSVEISNVPDSWSSSLRMADPSSISLIKINGKDPPAVRSMQKDGVDSANKMTEETANDFLHRIDSSIAKTRDQVAQKVSAAGVSYSYSENDLSNFDPPGGSASITRSRSARFKNSPHRLGETVSNNGELPACYIRTTDSKVRYSMRRLEQEQDELFQL